MEHYKKFIISFAHGNILSETGGVQKYILNLNHLLSDKQVDNYIIYPLSTKQNFYNKLLSNYYGLICNNTEVGIFDKDDLLAFFSTEMQKKNLLEIHLHHTKNYDLNSLNYILESFDAKIKYFIHDFYSVCPTIVMLNNNGNFCGGEHPSLIKCQNCKHREVAIEHYKKHIEFLKKHLPNISLIFPSESALKIWNSCYGDISADTSKVVIPHLEFEYRLQQENQFNNILRIGFVGAPIEMKGWDLFKKICDEVKGYEYYHFGYNSKENGNWFNIPITFLHNKRNSMVEAIKEKNVDIVLMLTKCAETYCYTLYESLQANAVIFCLNHPGNVADVVNRYNIGQAFNSIEDLKIYLNDSSRVKKDLNNKYSELRKYEITSNTSNRILQYIDFNHITQSIYVDHKIRNHMLIMLLYKIKELKTKIGMYLRMR